jgi:hypothetical protein
MEELAFARCGAASLSTLSTELLEISLRSLGILVDKEPEITPLSGSLVLSH